VVRNTTGQMKVWLD